MLLEISETVVLGIVRWNGGDDGQRTSDPVIPWMSVVTVTNIDFFGVPLMS